MIPSIVVVVVVLVVVDKSEIPIEMRVYEYYDFVYGQKIHHQHVVDA